MTDERAIQDAKAALIWYAVGTFWLMGLFMAIIDYFGG